MSKQVKQVFSVSQKYNEVFSILNGVENKSEFICQAIIEKFKGTNNIDDNALEEKIETILKKMILKDNLFIVSGNISNNISGISILNTPTVTENTSDNEISEEDDSDDYLRDVFRNM